MKFTAILFTLFLGLSYSGAYAQQNNANQKPAELKRETAVTPKSVTVKPTPGALKTDPKTTETPVVKNQVRTIEQSKMQVAPGTLKPTGQPTEKTAVRTATPVRKPNPTTAPSTTTGTGR